MKRHQLGPDSYEMQVIVCQVGSKEEESRIIEDCKSQFEFNKLEEKQVSAHSAFNKEQFLKWSHLWPMTFHEPRIKEKDFEEFSEEQVQRIREAVDKMRDYEAVIVDENFQVICSTNNSIKIHPLKHAAVKAIDEFCKSKNHLEQYLCTGMGIFLRSEPCVFCAMALVHSRFKNVFYLVNRTGSFVQMKIHENDKLNHHYVVYKVERSHPVNDQGCYCEF